MFEALKRETKEERREREFEELQAEIEAMAEITLDLEPGELYFPSIYQPMTITGAEGWSKDLNDRLNRYQFTTEKGD